MLKLTRLDQRTVAINPDHIAWVEANPDTTLCLIGDRKIIVRESLDEVCERFNIARAKIGCGGPIQVPTPQMSSRRPASLSGRPSGQFARASIPPAGLIPTIIDDPDGPPSSVGYRQSARPHGGA